MCYLRGIRLSNKTHVTFAIHELWRLALRASRRHALDSGEVHRVSSTFRHLLHHLTHRCPTRLPDLQPPSAKTAAERLNDLLRRVVASVEAVVEQLKGVSC